jgi:transposase
MNIRYTLRPSSELPIIYLYRHAVDFRRGHRGLSAMVQTEFGHDPFSQILYVFRNRAYNKLKILFLCISAHRDRSFQFIVTAYFGRS